MFGAKCIVSASSTYFVLGRCKKKISLQINLLYKNNLTEIILFFTLTKKNMKKFKASIFINAPKEKVWDTMLGKETYVEWTKPFNITSRFEGDWIEGSKILFLGTDENGNNEGGMVSRIAKNVPYEYLSIEHIGIIENGIEDTTSEKAKLWTPAFENYRLSDKDSGTEVTIEQDLDEQYVEMFEEMWGKALIQLKELSEK